MTPPRPFIVAEISKNWHAGRPVANPLLLSEQFEQVINHNAARGYELMTFQLCRLLSDDESLNETIVAVFRYVGTESTIERLKREGEALKVALAREMGV